jgi:putative ABC transport system permease protein
MLFLLFRESFLFAWQSLITNKLRSFLSLLGITIGIFAIIFVFTVVDGLERNIRGSFESLGRNVVFIQKWPWIFANEYPWWKYINRPVPQYHELGELQRKCRTAEAIAFRVWARRILKYKSNSVENVLLGGISHDFDRIMSFELSEGRYFTRAETDGGYRVAVLGAEIAAGLFPNENPIGKEIKIAGHKATVIGVIKKEGESLIDMSFDYQVLIPYNFARVMIDTHAGRGDPMMYAKTRKNVTNDEMKAELTGLLRAIRKLHPRAEDNFALNEISMIGRNLDLLFEVIGTAGWIIGGFSILVGGFGIANIMFVSVRERTNLIGIQKSLGARNIFILVQFLCESVMLSFIGGLFGLMLTWVITTLGQESSEIDISLTGSNIILGFTISILIGVISGFIPAYSASQLDPVEAIRSN